MPLGVSILFGLGMLGLTVAKRKDLLIAAEAVGLLRSPASERPGVQSRGEPRIVVDTSAIIDGRIAGNELGAQHARADHARQARRTAEDTRPSPVTSDADEGDESQFRGSHIAGKARKSNLHVEHR